MHGGVDNDTQDASSVQVTLLYAVGSDPKVGAARIGQTERRATLLDALFSAADFCGFIRTIVYT